MTEKDHSNGEREEEFLALFSASQRPLHAYILALVFEPNVTADILQETNIVLWQKFDQFEAGSNFLAWAREIARINVLRHRQKSSKAIAVVNPSLLEPLAVQLAESVQSKQGEQKEALDQCLSKLGSADRNLILARYAPGASVSELANQLNRSAHSVSQSLLRIRRALMKCTQRQLGHSQQVLTSE